MMQIIDAARLLENPPPPIEWALAGVLPVGTVGDIFGPPGDGKSSLTLDFAIAVASGAGTWFGLPCVAGPVVLLGGERSGMAAFSRDLHRAVRARQLDPGMLIVPQDAHGECPPLLAWDKKADSWDITSWGDEITEWLKSIRPALIIIDTLISAATGANIIDQPQQYALGVTIRRWAKNLCDPTVLTISHTNQASAQQELAWRLHYLSRAGGNGLPGALRWAAGVSRISPSDALCAQLNLCEKVRESRFIAFGVSKNNEMPRACWNNETPALFELKSDGGLLLVADGNEVAQKLRQAATDKTDAKKKKTAVVPFGRGNDHDHNKYLQAKNGGYSDDAQW
jgi:archaellum biogenesis ATPase FlaH